MLSAGTKFDPTSDALIPIYDPTSKWQTAKNLATDVWKITSWPEEDLAGALGWDAGWLIMTLGILKVMSLALHAEFKKR